MILRKDSRMFRTLMVLWSPVQWLPPLFPLFAEPARVGTNCTDYVKVSFRKPRKPTFNRNWMRRMFR